MTVTATTPTTASKTYDPLTRITGMFNGCVVRLAQAIKDPAKFGESTKVIIQECAKQYQDALDDCEIQILDAKWYLERQLAINKAKREAAAKAKEGGDVTGKRKFDEIKEIGEKEGKEEEVKRQKVEKSEPEKAAEAVNETTRAAKAAQPVSAEETPSKLDSNPDQKSTVEDKPKPDQKPQTSTSPKSPTKKPPSSIKIPDKPPDPTPDDSANPQSTTDAFPQSTPQVTPGPTSDEFNFVSMFREASQDAGGDDDNNGEMIFDDLDSGDGFGSGLGAGLSGDMGNDGGMMAGQNQNPMDDYDTLLPGLESYANQSDNNNNARTNNGTGNNSTSLGFELPSLDAPNDFDALLNDDFGDVPGITGMGGMNMDMNMDLTDAAMDIENVNFDSMFGDEDDGK